MPTKNKDVQKIQNDIKKLPDQMSSNDIVRMYCELKKDMIDLKNRGDMSPKPVSYTHLTLPTIYSV